MLNLRTTLIEDIEGGIAAAIAAGDLASVEKLPEVVVKQTESDEHGDYASPVALSLTKLMGKPPLEIVEAIVTHMEKKEYIGKMEAAAPGFLNIRLNPGWMTARLDDVVEQDVCTDISIGAGKSVNLEFISANPTGPMTMGNARTAFSADTLANILSCAGYNVTREYYINDAGNQVKRLGESVLRRMLQAQGEDIEFPEEMYQGEYIKDVAVAIAERWREDEGKEFEAADLEDSHIIDLVAREAVTKLQSENEKTAIDVLKVRFDVWTSEYQLRESGAVEKTVKKLEGKGEVYEQDGAKWLRTSAHGDEKDRVIQKKDGEYAYIAPDIAYFENKYAREYDHILTFLGADHLGHVPSMTAAMKILGYDTSKLEFPVAQWVRFLREGKPIALSKRKGNITTPQDLIDEVGYDAARFFMLQHALSSHMDFDLDLAKERSDRNPVYYVQYAHVRLQSILRKAKEEGVIEDVGVNVKLSSNASLTHTTEVVLMKKLYLFSEIIADIAETHATHQLAYYAHDLAKAVHVFYKHVPVLSADNPEVVLGRLQLVVAARAVLSKTLDLLGISKPDVM